MPVSQDDLLPGLADPVLDAQRVFRAVLDAMAHPGTVVALDLALVPPAPLDLASAALVLALADFETALWLDTAQPALASYLRFHCGCSLSASPEAAVFALITDAMNMSPLDVFGQGTDEYPDRATTLIVQVPGLTGGPPWRLRGPGIETSTTFAPLGLPVSFAAWVEDNHALFPRGVDIIFTCGAALAALPRSTRLEA